MSVDMSKLATENPEAHAYILQLRGEAAENRVKANEEAAARAIAEAKVTSAESQVTELKSKVTEFETNKTVDFSSVLRTVRPSGCRARRPMN